MAYFVFNEKYMHSKTTVEKTQSLKKEKSTVIKDGNIIYILFKWEYSNFRINVCLPTFFNFCVINIFIEK